MVILGVGNILLDIMVKVKDESLIKKYNVQKDSQKELNKEDMKMLMKDISLLDMQCRPGGAAQNTMRVLQWILNIPRSTFMVGAIGRDKQGFQLRQFVEKDGVITHFIEDNEEATGKAIAVIIDATRTLIANIGASMKINISKIEHSDDIQGALNNCKIIYMEGFFITERFDTANYFVKYANQNNKAFVFNVSAPYLCEKYGQDMKYFVENCDILFGNINEFNALCKAMNISDIDTLFDHLVSIYKNGKEMEYGKIIVMTNGAKNVLCRHSDNVRESFNVPPVDKSKIKDTVGAGDSFVAGFIAALCSGKDPSIALTWGCKAAREIIQQSGCTIPNHDADF